MEKTQGFKESRQQVGGLPWGCSEGLSPENVTQFLLHVPNDRNQDCFSRNTIKRGKKFCCSAWLESVGPFRPIGRWLVAHLN